MINLLFVFSLSICQISYAQELPETKNPPSFLLPEKTLFSQNITYKTNSLGTPVSLDLYRPKTSSSEKLPVVIYVHGGAWAKGDKVIRANNYIENFILKLVEKTLQSSALNIL